MNLNRTLIGSLVLSSMAIACAKPKPDVPTPSAAAALSTRPAKTDGLQPVRIGGAIREPRKTKHVPPRYPAEARAAGLMGTVTLEGVVGTDGRVGDIKVLRGLSRGLTEAAIDAVRQWEYEPTLVDGKPVPVSFTITVTFSVSGRS